MRRIFILFVILPSCFSVLAGAETEIVVFENPKFEMNQQVDLGKPLPEISRIDIQLYVYGGLLSFFCLPDSATILDPWVLVAEVGNSRGTANAPVLEFGDVGIEATLADTSGGWGLVENGIVDLYLNHTNEMLDDQTCYHMEWMREDPILFEAIVVIEYGGQVGSECTRWGALKALFK